MLPVSYMRNTKEKSILAGTTYENSRNLASGASMFLIHHVFGKRTYLSLAQSA
jgi:hypothetical protein